MNSTAIVAGAGRHSDFSVTLITALKQRGHHVVVVTRREETRTALVEALAGASADVVVEVADLCDEAAVSAVVQRAEAVAPVEVVVHAAARLVVSPFAETTLETFEAAWRANVATAIVVARCALPKMAERGCGTLLLTGATASIRGGAKFAAFASAKFALRGLGQSLAREYGPQGVHRRARDRGWHHHGQSRTTDLGQAAGRLHRCRRSRNVVLSAYRPTPLRLDAGDGRAPSQRVVLSERLRWSG